VVVPTLLLLSALFVWLDRGSGLTRAPPWLSPRTGVAGFVVVAALVSFEVGDRASRGSLTWSAPLAQARAVCATTQAPIVRVPVSPPVFGLAAELPCAKVQ
jgi:hypothetical protein